jgi:transposase
VLVPGEAWQAGYNQGALQDAAAVDAHLAAAEAVPKHKYSRLPALSEAAHTIGRHWDGILHWFESKIANRPIEGINSLVEAAKAKVRGCGSARNLKPVVCLPAGKLGLTRPA